MAKTGDGRQHALQYAVSDRSTCHASSSCRGSFIPKGSLRYGAKSFSEQYGEGWLWRHWGCVTPEILATLRNVKVTQIDGWSKLRSDDKGRVMGAVKAGRVAPGDVPASAKPLDRSLRDQIPVTSSQSTVVGQKRKLESSSSAPSTQVAPSQVIDLDESDDEFGVPPIEEDSKDEHYLDLNSQVVGVQYYKGLVGHNEQVNLVREPHNKYDKNAIQVMNLANKQVGHLKKEISVRLSPLIDANLVVVEGTIHEGNMSGFAYSIPLTLYIYGAANARAQLEPLLKWATPGQRGFTDALRNKYKYQAPAPPSTQAIGGYGAYGSSQPSTSYPSSSANDPYGRSSQLQKDQAVKLDAERRAKLAAERFAYQKAEELKAVIKSFESVDDETRRSSLLDTLCSNEDILNLPLHEIPPSIASGELTTNLMKHQIQALKWCLDREYPTLPKKPSDTPVQFWQYTAESRNPKPTYVNLISRQPVALDDPPLLGRGAIFADSMGLGKTLSMISLIIATRKDVPKDFSNCTLIVAPVSVLRTWEAQILEHCANGLLSVYTYHEKGREISPSQLQKYDVVITSYSTCAGDFARISGGKQPASAGPSKKQKGTSAIYSIAWKRIILDEGHTIRNAKTKQHEALCNLKSERRWVVTGTPIINSPKDLGSLLNFLKVCKPLDELDYFNRALIRPLSKGDPSAATLLKGLMSQICLRRTKEMQNAQGEYLVDLPPVEMTVVRVTLDDETRELYDEIEQLSQERFMRHIDGNQVKIPSNALAMLTRLRQLTLHRNLVPKSYLEELRLLNIEDENNAAREGGTPITPAERLRLQNRLFQIIEDSEECPVCFDLMTSPRITPCAHAFCLDCITGAIQRDPKCPMDRRNLALSDLIEPLPRTDATQAQIRVDLDSEEEDDDVHSGSSAKIDQLIHLLQLTPATEKSVVFSQFTSFLDKIAEQLTEAEIPFVRFDGSMSAAKRKDVLERFNMPLQEAIASSAPNKAVNGKRNARTSHSRRIVESDDDDEMGIPPNVDLNPSSSARPRRTSVKRASAVGDSFLSTLSSDDEERAKEKRPRLSFLPELSSDDDDLDNPAPVDLTTTSQAKSKGKARVTDLSSDDFDPSNEMAEVDSDGDSDAHFIVDETLMKSKSKGKGKPVSSTQRKAVDRQAVLRSYDIDERIPVVMLISLKAGALGLQLTAANNVYLMDPWWQEGIESQAIDRCNRIGQTKNVHVFQLIAENTIESKVLEIQERKRLLIKQAFSGTKSKETQRSTKKEARLQDLIELFGVRRELASTQGARSVNNKTALSINIDSD